MRRRDLFKALAVGPILAAAPYGAPIRPRATRVAEVNELLQWAPTMFKDPISGDVLTAKVDSILDDDV